MAFEHSNQDDFSHAQIILLASLVMAIFTIATIAVVIFLCCLRRQNISHVLPSVAELKYNESVSQLHLPPRYDNVPSPPPAYTTVHIANLTEVHL